MWLLFVCQKDQVLEASAPACGSHVPLSCAFSLGLMNVTVCCRVLQCVAGSVHGDGQPTTGKVSSTHQPALHILVAMDIGKRCIHRDLIKQAGTLDVSARRGCGAWCVPQGMADRGIYIRPCMLRSRALRYSAKMLENQASTNPRRGWPQLGGE